MSKTLQVRKGDTVYRIEWKRNSPKLMQYEVESVSFGLWRLTNAGKTIDVKGSDGVELFAATATEAVLQEFTRLADQVVRGETDSLSALRQVLHVNELLS